MKMEVKILGEVDVSQGEVLTQPSGNNAPSRLGGRRDDFNGQGRVSEDSMSCDPPEASGVMRDLAAAARGRRARSSMWRWSAS